MKCHVIIAAAGMGKRFGGEGKKQFATLGGLSLLERCLKIFRECGRIDRLIICLSADEMKSFHARGKEFRAESIEGGKTRAESVFLGFQFLNSKGDDAILIHDAVRPLTSRDLISRVIAALEGNDAAVPILPVSDTVKRIRDGRVAESIDRMELGLAQTPQAFWASVLRAAYDKAGKRWDWTDEAILVEKMGGGVASVEGEKTNIKITTPEDLRLAEFLLKGA